MHQLYTVWFFHGENTSVNTIDPPPVQQVEEIIVEENIEEQGVGVENLVDVCYGVHGEPYVDVECGQSRVSKEDHVVNDKYNEYKRLSVEKLYPSCEGPETTLSSIIELHNLKKKFGWSGNSSMELSSILKRWLPKDNRLPKNIQR